MKKILEFLARITQDKLLHYMYAQIIFVIVGGGLSFAVPDIAATIIGVCASILLLIWKEYFYDRKHKGSVELADIIIGLFGILVIVLMIILL